MPGKDGDEIVDVRPFIGARDFELSTRFYQLLGWKLVYDSPKLRVLELGGHRFYLQNYYQQQWCENTMLHIAIADVDAWFERVSHVFDNEGFESDARISGQVQDEGYARVFYVWDPAGVLLHFAQFAG
jgi:catechol 2,3-dioxygenase-like lactoylglutathione lyase family enzyme